jgi:hypothetical protein
VRQAGSSTTLGCLTADLEKFHNEHAHMCHGLFLKIGKFSMRFGIQDKKAAYVDITFSREWCSGVKSKIWLLFYKRESFVPVILTEIV